MGQALVRSFSAAIALLALMLSATACAPVHTSSAAAAAPACPTLEITEIAAPSDAHARRLQTADGDVFFIHAHALATTQDVIAARPATAEGHAVLEIDLSPTSAAALRAFTAAHVGSRLAFIVNDRVRNVVRVLDPLRGEGLIIDPVAPAEAQALARCMHAQS
jgi:preprotein translocase subunit SecD